MFVAILFASLLAQGPTPINAPARKPTPASTSPAPKTSRPAPVAIPAGAKPVGPAAWEFRDAAGKEWLYRQTPFGISRSPKEALKAPSSTAPKPSENITAVEEGEQVRFTRTGPFGATEWTKPAAALNDVEREALERTRKSKASTAGAAQ